MEVHHHPHIPTHAKPWKEYLLEGLMIFVAVTLGYGAENIREHYVETKKAIISAKNLYVDVTYDSIGYAGTKKSRDRQDSCFEIINTLYNNKDLDKNIPTIYAAHGYMALRMLHQMNTLALDEVKSSGTLKFLESDELKAAIQRYASLGAGLKLREQREFGYIDRMMDPISTKNFEFNFHRAAGDNFKIEGNKIIVTVPIPANLKMMKKDELDWDNYISILGMLQTIRKSTNKDYIEPTQEQCHELLTLLRNYLIEHDALENNNH
ncbi:MAG: hypothetical protein RL544_1066 [Bacteroidota bacterium]|jgi:hypothetical protein